MSLKPTAVRCALLTMILAVSACAAVAQGAVTNPIPGDPVRIDAGKVAGTLLPDGVKAYLGIPFAAPPIGDLRWRAPQPAKPWNGILNANRIGPGCINNDRVPAYHSPEYDGEEQRSEDCLYLNVWVPKEARANAKLPVLVWIHGGGFGSLAAEMPDFGGDPLANKGVVYVNIEYRTGVFGFLVLPELSKESKEGGSGDWGLMDQVAALQWVQRNIGSFGGNPANVTIMGESAGSMSVSVLQASPLAKGLFKRVIGMSGTFMPTGGEPIDTLAQGEAKGEKIEATLKAGSLEEMRNAPWDRVKAAVQEAHVRPFPDIDGTFLPQAPQDIFAQGKQNDVPVLATGTGNDLFSNVEMGEVKTLEQYQSLAKQQYGADSATLLKLFPASNDKEAAEQGRLINSITGFGLAARDWARRQTETGKQPAYWGSFQRVEPLAPGMRHDMPMAPLDSASHASDVVYWLGTFTLRNTYMHTRDWTPWDYKLSDAMQNVLVNFARDGVPTTGTSTVPRYDPAHEARLVFGNSSIFVQNMNSAQLDFIQAHPVKVPFGGPTPPPAQHSGH